MFSYTFVAVVLGVAALQVSTGQLTIFSSLISSLLTED
jgi:hypothetical protein